MDILIVYTSNYGSTTKVVERLSRQIGLNRCRIVNLMDEPLPILVNFHTIVIGGAIRNGTLNDKILKFCSTHLQTLLEKRVGLFITCMCRSKLGQQYFDLFPYQLIKHAEIKELFGGELNFKQLNVIERFIARIKLNYKGSVRRIDSQAINHFAILIQKSFENTYS